MRTGVSPLACSPPHLVSLCDHPSFTLLMRPNTCEVWLHGPIDSVRASILCGLGVDLLWDARLACVDVRATARVDRSGVDGSNGRGVVWAGCMVVRAGETSIPKADARHPPKGYTAPHHALHRATTASASHVSVSVSDHVVVDVGVGVGG